jgi:hypothetical protein
MGAWIPWLLFGTRDWVSGPLWPRVTRGSLFPRRCKLAASMFPSLDSVPIVEADANVLLESVAGKRVGTSWHPRMRKVSLPRKFSESRSSLLTTRKRLRSVTEAAHARTHARLEGSGA